MDLVTQAVLGAAIGEAGFRRKLGRGAILGGALFGMLPDADIISGLWGPWASMVHHRGITHALIFAPVMCAPLGYLAYRLTKRQASWKTWAHLAFWALWTHPMLDVFTTYGTQLMLPMSDKRFALDGVSIIDPMYTLPLMLAIFLGRRFKDRPHIGKRAAWIALIATTLYLGLGMVMAGRARHHAALELTRQAHPAPTRLKATPTFANILAWRVIAQQADQSLLVGFTSNLVPGPIAFTPISRPQSSLITRAQQDERVKTFEWFNEGWSAYHIDEQASGATTLTISDMRYGGLLQPARAMWGVRVYFDPNEELRDVKRFNDRPTDRMGKEINALRTLILTGSPPPESPHGEAARP